jgi:hypothetical protein
LIVAVRDRFDRVNDRVAPALDTIAELLATPAYPITANGQDCRLWTDEVDGRNLELRSCAVDYGKNAFAFELTHAGAMLAKGESTVAPSGVEGRATVELGGFGDASGLLIVEFARTREARSVRVVADGKPSLGDGFTVSSGADETGTASLTLDGDELTLHWGERGTRVEARRCDPDCITIRQCVAPSGEVRYERRAPVSSAADAWPPVCADAVARTALVQR